MNFNFYILGNLPGYSQYPDETFPYKQVLPQSFDGAMLAIKRDGKLIHYIYVQTINGKNNEFIGAAFVFNGIYIKKVSDAVFLLQETCNDAVLGGFFFKIGLDGQTTRPDLPFACLTNEYERIRSNINRKLEDGQQSHFSSLPTVYNTTGKPQTLGIKSSNEEIYRAVNSCEYVTLSSRPMPSGANYLSRIISDQYKELTQLKAEYDTLKHQKKQYMAVTVVFIVLLLTIVGALYMNDSLNNIIHKNELSIGELENTVTLTKSTIGELNERIEIKDKEIQKNTKELAGVRDSLAKNKKIAEQQQSLLNEISNRIPLLINSADIAIVNNNGYTITDYGYPLYSSKTKYLKPRIYYKGLDSGNHITLYIKLYTPNGIMSTGSNSPSGYSTKFSFTIEEGNNYQELVGWGAETSGHWSAGTYRYEFWYDGRCLGSKTFTIY